MSREVRFTATDEEYAKIAFYVDQKRKWKRVSDFARYAVFTAMDRSKAGRHDLVDGAYCADTPEQGN